MASLCTQLLPTGKTCACFALKGKPYCPAHRDSGVQQRTAHTRLLVESIPDMDMLSLAALLHQTVQDLRARLVPPLHAEAIFAAAANRLEEQTEEPPTRSSKPTYAS